ncbi:hypothetical protein FQN54_009079 [Arachnomyces sp. PD_36]|nr:hypothetical protein FQN54_009079 [Arachnomyces sp. PD_36]
MNIYDIPIPPRPSPPPRRYSDYSVGGYDVGQSWTEHLNPKRRPVIGPLSLEIDFVKYECDDEGLKIYGHRYDPDMHTLIPRVLKEGNGSISKYQPILETHGPRYWKAQAAFRGYNPRGYLWDLLDLLKERPHQPMAPWLIEAESELIDEYIYKDSERRKELWVDMTFEEKAKEDPAMFIKETFVDRDDFEVVVLKTITHRFPVHVAASSKDLHHTATNAPLLPDGTKRKVDRWLVIARTYELVDMKVKEIKQECATVAAEIEAARLRKEEEERLEKERIERQLKISAAHDRLWMGCHIDTGAAPLDVIGRWAITAPRIDNEYGSATRKCTMFLVYCMDDEGSCHMWANFDFIALNGMFRFENPDNVLACLNIDSDDGSVVTSVDGPVVANNGEEDDDQDTDYKDNTEEDDAEDEDPEECPEEHPDSDDGDEVEELQDTSNEEVIPGDGSIDTTQSTSIFYIGNMVKPSVSLPTWDFRWRGHSSDGEFQFGSEEDICTIRFKPSGYNGYTLEGLFCSQLLGDFEFQGYKMFNKPRLAPYPNNPYVAVKAWNDLAPTSIVEEDSD